MRRAGGGGLVACCWFSSGFTALEGPVEPCEFLRVRGITSNGVPEVIIRFDARLNGIMINLHHLRM
jgi:hypothetical protein